MVDKKIHKIRLQIQAFESKTLNDCCKEITMGMKQINSIIKGPIPMPTKKRIYCVLRSPHVNKDSREHFEIRVHKKFFDIFTTSNAPFLNGNNTLLDLLRVPSGYIKIESPLLILSSSILLSILTFFLGPKCSNGARRKLF